MNRTTCSKGPLFQNAMVFLSFLVSCCAMILTWHQAQLSSRGVSAQTWQGFTAQGNEISRVFLDHPELRPYFYDGKSVATDDENRNRVMALAEMYLDFMESFEDPYVFELPGMAKDGKFRLQWEQYFKDMFESSPTLRMLANERKPWYSTDFTKLNATGSKSIQQNTPNK